MKYIAIIFFALLVSVGCGSVSNVETPNLQQAPEAPKDHKMFLTVPEMERVDNLPVYSGRGMEQALHDSLYRDPRSGFPWLEGENTYIAGHRLGYPGTKSWKVFDDLGDLENGDKVYLDDANGTRYTYKVYDEQVVAPDAIEVLEPVGKDIVTLQTCTLPAYKDRLIVRAERIQ